MGRGAPGFLGKNPLSNGNGPILGEEIEMEWSTKGRK
jgi:hypothetical protein